MHPAIAEKRDAVAALCRRYGVTRLELFGSGARGLDFNPAESDADFLVEFETRADMSSFDQFFGLAEALEETLGRRVDLVDRRALDASRNYIRRRSILADAEVVYG